MFRLIGYAAAALSALMLALFPAFCNAEEAEEDELTPELIRQIGLLDLEGWDSFFREEGFLSASGFAGADELLLALAEGKPEEPAGLFDALRAIARKELKASLGVFAALAAAAAVTALPALIPDDGIKPVLGLALCLTAAALSVGAFSALCGRTYAAVKRAEKLTEYSVPVISGMLAAMGSPASAGVMKPLMVFLSGTVLGSIESFALPVSAVCGVLAAANCISGEGRLSGFVKLAGTAVRSLLGIMSAVFAGVTAVRGMTMGLKDGVAIRTARYALGRMVPIVGSMVSGTAESIMGCALLVKNGIGAAAALLIVSVMAAPIFALVSALVIFRAAAAFSGAFADMRIVRLYSDMAEAIKNLLACAAAAASMFAAVVAVFIAAGGMTAGLW